MATTTKQVTPGFNCRVSIFFQSDKNGRKCAYYWTGFVSGRAIRMKLAEAEMLVAQDLADLLPCHPLKTPQEVAIVEEVTKPQLTEETITYTIVERNEQGKSPFYARVFVPGEEVQDFDPIRHDAWWQHTKSDLVFAVNKAFKGAWYLSPEKLDERVAEMTKPTIEDITPEQTQEESYTLTCSVCGHQETRDKNKTYQGIPRHCNKVMRIDFSEWESTPKQTKTFIIKEEAHPLKANATIYRAYHQNEDGTVGQPCYIGGETIEEVERRLRTSEKVSTVVVMPLQRQEEVQHMERQNDTSITAQIKQTVVASITDGTIPDGVYVDQKYRGELQNVKTLVICGHDISILYEDKDFMEGLPVMAYGIHKLMESQPQEQEVEDGLDIIQQEMAEQVENRNLENAHIHADQLLVNLVNVLAIRLGDSKAMTQVEDILRSYDNVGKWYQYSESR